MKIDELVAIRLSCVESLTTGSFFPTDATSVRYGIGTRRRRLNSVKKDEIAEDNFLPFVV